ncbi:type I restriction enzyme HsdR N-terminal domain-containing protein [Acinetobacter pittii]|uniref:type I restriction enzyme HsdR N-terminal domain-containing protein n=1 Tax=Acinetobacter pittii TaxID=48296 RepID=UPI001F05EB59|nr:type I restriction enzyme HsdR N-terminal domain-containing protein [Acinetobacter pittii]MCH2071137.1 type I restriction enzyme HsdR N-terminal domain-containing protein [Acinetobacter pittii]
MSKINIEEALISSSKVLSEDDVRSKIVIPWLIERGFNLNDLSVEFSFSIRFGRSVVNVEKGGIIRQQKSTSKQKDFQYSYFRPRADVLVRNMDGKNLLIIEVKGPNESLDNDARDQGISYARMLEGNIAPCLVLTNGKETKIFDTLTKVEITDSEINLNIGSYIQNFRVGEEYLSLQTEALENLISLSSENLVSFCEVQTTFRMRPLRSEDLNSNKKYIPALYIEREEARKKLLKLIDERSRRVILVVGAPQIGKTNFICHMVEDRLKQGTPCLFYPAIGLMQGLLGEIAEDFGWILKDGNSTSNYIVQKLINILRKGNKRLLIFIDGWNEANTKLARIIDQESERLASNHIQIIISLTHVAASRLLRGEGGNPSFISEAASIPVKAIQLIEISPEYADNSLDSSVINIKKYSPGEYEEAYRKYSLAYNVRVPNSHQRVDDPYTLGIAMNLFQDGVLPNILEEPILLEQIIKEKINRTIGLAEHNIQVCLTILAKEMFEKDAPVKIERVCNLWNIPLIEKIPSGFFDAALLSQVTNELNSPAIDFYYGKERDFIISYWVQDWFSKLKNKQEISNIFDMAVQSNAGLEALRWFLKQVKHIEYLQLVTKKLPKYENPKIQQILLSALYDISVKHLINKEEWLNYAIDQVFNNQSNLVKIEAVKLISLLTEDSEELMSVLPDDSSLKSFIEAILSVDGEYSLESKATGVVVLDALRSLHWELHEGDPEKSIVTKALMDLNLSESSIIRESAATCLGYVSPFALLELILLKIQSGILVNKIEMINEYNFGLENAHTQLHEMYYGHMCPGILEGMREDQEIDDSLKNEYEKMYILMQPIVSIFPQTGAILGLMSILEDLRPQNYINEKSRIEVPFLDISTLQLPFGDK